jgi:hypothetical protein
VFRDTKGNVKTIINNPYYNTSTQEEELENDFAALPRHRVIVSEAPSGVNNRLVQRELNTYLTSNFAQISPNSALCFVEDVIESLDKDQVQKEEALKAVALDRERLAAETIAATVNAKAMTKQTEQMMSQPSGGMPGMGGGAVPAVGPEQPAALPGPEQSEALQIGPQQTSGLDAITELRQNQ